MNAEYNAKDAAVWSTKLSMPQRKEILYRIKFSPGGEFSNIDAKHLARDTFKLLPSELQAVIPTYYDIRGSFVQVRREGLPSS